MIVAFEEGDPDQPCHHRQRLQRREYAPVRDALAIEPLNGLKSSTARGQAHENYNGILFVDVQGHEHLAIHSERHMVFNSELDKLSHAGRHKTERVSSDSMFTVGSLPGGGGSGGGPNNDLLEPPRPAAVLGLNSAMVYGQNLQVAMPLNHQIAVGSNLQLCINPAGLAAGVPGLPASAGATGALGGGLGGNMQFTIGTSANIVLGRSFDINFGPKKIESAPKGDLMLPFCGIVGGLAAIWPLVYGLVDDDDARADLSIAFQTAIDISLLALTEMITDAKVLQDKTDEEGGAICFQYGNKIKGQWTEKASLKEGFEAAMVATAVLGVGILPEVLAAKNENWNAPSQSSSPSPSCTPCPSSSPSSSGSPSSSSPPKSPRPVEPIAFTERTVRTTLPKLIKVITLTELTETIG